MGENKNTFLVKTTHLQIMMINTHFIPYDSDLIMLIKQNDLKRLQPCLAL